MGRYSWIDQCTAKMKVQNDISVPELARILVDKWKECNEEHNKLWMAIQTVVMSFVCRVYRNLIQ